IERNPHHEFCRSAGVQERRRRGRRDQGRKQTASRAFGRHHPDQAARGLDGCKAVPSRPAAAPSLARRRVAVGLCRAADPAFRRSARRCVRDDAARRAQTGRAGEHDRKPEVRLELVTDTNDALLGQLAERGLDAAFMAESPAGRAFEHIPVFAERLSVISSPDHPPIKRARDVEGASLIAFPEGCAYRRVLQRWLGRDSLASLRVLELSSYHAIVACVTAGAGIALMPESVLDTMPQAKVRRHPIPKAQAHITTPLVWRRGEISPSVLALRTLVASLPRQRSPV